VWGYLGPFSSHGSEGVEMVGTRGRDSTVSPPVGNGVKGICARGIQ
jgi:hypothetical protein